MSGQTKKFICAYLLFVGLPLAGLTAILRAGRNLVAPLSVDGTWTVETEPGQAALSLCLKSAANVPVTISQSGRNLAFHMAGDPRVISSGRIDGDLLRASLLPEPEWLMKSDICPNISGLSLTARINRMSRPRTLEGMLSVTGCASCRPVRFKAIRQTAMTKGSE